MKNDRNTPKEVKIIIAESFMYWSESSFDLIPRANQNKRKNFDQH